MLGWLAFLVLLMPATVAAVWSGGAIYYDVARARKPLAPALFVVWLIVHAALLIVIAPLWMWLCVSLAGSAAVFLAWRRIPPRSDRAWLPEYAHQTAAHVDGDVATVSHVRNARFSGDEAEVVFEERRYRLSHLRSVDLVMSYWATPLLCHPLMIFEFHDDASGATDRLAWSVEARHAHGSSFSVLHALYHAQELVCLALDERDLLTKRLRITKPSQVYLYRLELPIETARRLFLQCMEIANRLAERPRWYHAVTTNCLTAVYTQSDARQLPLDLRLLINGRLDQYLHERGLLAGGLPFDELRARSHVNPVIEPGSDPDRWPGLVRERLPGFGGSEPSPDADSSRVVA